MARAVAKGVSEPEDLFDGGPWDMEPGVDFGVFPVEGWTESDEWRDWAIRMKAIARQLGGEGHAAQIVHRRADLSIKRTIYRWMYLAREKGWRGGL